MGFVLQKLHRNPYRTTDNSLSVKIINLEIVLRCQVKIDLKYSGLRSLGAQIK